ncbi:alpha/beta hydrolase [Chthonobacter albigriseus]|uniref:alpha/beta hydrolase n=1 Tax=Chthonobacter albigriseus TaxID=1683161 RepID=UPI0015EED934|nr:alpha/beta hydrolase family protein [Chthonobacter albigriseus]
MRVLLKTTAFLMAGTLPAFAGTVTYRSFDLQALDTPMNTAVYTPDGTAPFEGWPVVYLLHGHNGTERSWTDLGDVEATLDRMMADGEIRPAVIVMPDAKNSWYVDSAERGGPGDYETAITRDLRKAIEASYPVRRDREGRAIAGLSMGGFGALRLALAHPDLYVASASFSGAIWQNVPKADLEKTPDDLKEAQHAAFFQRQDAATVTAGVILPAVGDHYSGSFGKPFEGRYFNADNVFTLLAMRLQEKAELPAFYISCGDDDGYALWRGAFALYTMMEDSGVSAEFRVTDGAHVWSLWAREIENGLAFIDKHFQTAPAVAEAPDPLRGKAELALDGDEAVKTQ